MKICDAHNDFLSEANQENREKLAKQFSNQGVKMLGCAVFTTNKNITIADVENCAKELQLYNKKFNCKFLLTIEDLGFIKTEQDMQKLVQLKPFSVTLTWNENNQFAGGALDNGGLTKLGRKTVEHLERNNIFVDTAHLNKRSFWQFCKITTKPIFCSHANLFSVCRHKRNLTDKQISEIVKSDGFLGLTVYQNFISTKQISSEDVANQFAYLLSKFGNKNFGFGTDFFGVEKDFLPTDINSYSNLNKINCCIHKLGATEADITNLFHKNFERFYKNTNK